MKIIIFLIFVLSNGAFANVMGYDHIVCGYIEDINTIDRRVSITVLKFWGENGYYPETRIRLEGYANKAETLKLHSFSCVGYYDDDFGVAREKDEKCLSVKDDEGRPIHIGKACYLYNWCMSIIEKEEEYALYKNYSFKPKNQIKFIKNKINTQLKELRKSLNTAIKDSENNN